ncbi:MAG: hypothetical protein ACKVU2_17220 [Saprospiraceae bacterium]
MLYDNINPFNQYRLWIIVGVGLMSIFLLWTVWRYYYYLRRRPKDEPTDYGLVYLMGGILVWALLAILKLDALPGKLDSFQLHFLSMLNNGLLLSSLPFFEYSKLNQSNRQLKRYWTAISIGGAMSVLVLICFVKDEKAANILDWGFSSIIFLILGDILARTFHRRRLSPIGKLALLVMYMTIFSQFIVTFADTKINTSSCPLFIPPALQNIGYVLGGISFAMLLVLLVALAFTWILDDNLVIESWNDEFTAQEFWDAYKDNWSGGVKTLQDDLSDGISRAFLTKCTHLFTHEKFPYKESLNIQRLKEDINAFAGTFNTAEKLFNSGQIPSGDFQQTASKTHVGVGKWLSDLLKAIHLEEANQKKAEKSSDATSKTETDNPQPNTPDAPPEHSDSNQSTSTP